MSPSPLVVFDGQSRLNTPVADLASSVPVQTMTGLPYAWHNTSMSGWGWDLLTNNGYPPALRVDQFLNHHSHGILVLLGGEGDMGAFTGHTVSQAYDDWANYVAARRSAGWDYIIGTTWADIPDWNDADITPAEAAQMNEWIRSSTICDAIVDLAAFPELDGSESIFEDTLHWNALGASRTAERLRPAIQRAVNVLRAEEG
jgi:hypothetical protein